MSSFTIHEDILFIILLPVPYMDMNEHVKSKVSMNTSTPYAQIFYNLETVRSNMKFHSLTVFLKAGFIFETT